MESDFHSPVWGKVRNSVFPEWVVSVECVCAIRLLCSFCKYRLVAEYIGYTYIHLPAWNGDPGLPKNAEAIFAIFAARIALSNLEILSRLK